MRLFSSNISLVTETSECRTDAIVTDGKTKDNKRLCCQFPISHLTVLFARRHKADKSLALFVFESGTSATGRETWCSILLVEGIANLTVRKAKTT